jgi:hypothetical protein
VYNAKDVKIEWHGEFHFGMRDQLPEFA